MDTFFFAFVLYNFLYYILVLSFASCLCFYFYPSLPFSLCSFVSVYHSFSLRVTENEADQRLIIAQTRKYGGHWSLKPLNIKPIRL